MSLVALRNGFASFTIRPDFWVGLYRVFMHWPVHCHYQGLPFHAVFNVLFQLSAGQAPAAFKSWPLPWQHAVLPFLQPSVRGSH